MGKILFLIFSLILASCSNKEDCEKLVNERVNECFLRVPEEGETSMPEDMRMEMKAQCTMLYFSMYDLWCVKGYRP